MLYWIATHADDKCEEMLRESEKMFDKARLAIPEEEWLILYMKGKIHEKLGKIEEPIELYFKALDWMDAYAEYSKKIQYKIHSGNYSHETLELFYRINALILKSYEQKGNDFKFNAHKNKTLR
jgi:tetratricopeptide (TPR) repeat protein